jgi:acyl-coenzyme A thioesterase PaaI-like protein
MKQISPPFPTGKIGSFVSSTREENPIRISYWKTDSKDTLLAKVYFEKFCEGPPGHVHGGCQAAVLDEVMGSSAWAFGHAVVAAKIEIEFLEMIPLESTYWAQGKVLKTEGKKVFLEGKIQSEDGKVYAQSSGLFIVLSEDRLTELKKNIP